MIPTSSRRTLMRVLVIHAARRYRMNYSTTQARAVTINRTMPSQYVSPLTRYHELVSAHVIERDARQEQLLERLEQVAQSLLEFSIAGQEYLARLEQWNSEVEAESILRVKKERDQKRADAERHQQRWGALHRWLPSSNSSTNTSTSSGADTSAIEHPLDAEELEIMRKVVQYQRRASKPVRPTTPTGAYIYGGVGVGKSLCADLFYSSIAPFMSQHRRVHFHSIMLEAYYRMHAYNRAKSNAAAESWTGPDNPLIGIARELLDSTGIRPVTSDLTALAGLSPSLDAPPPPHDDDERHHELLDRPFQAKLLCFDEFMANDVGDAAILRVLFEAIWNEDAVVVLTSNRAPEDLNKDGLQATLWRKFAQRLSDRCTPFHISTSTDYRQWRIEREQGVDNSKDFKYLRLLPAGSSISAHEAIQREYEQSEFVAHTAAPPLVIQSNVKLPVLFRREFPLSHFAHGIGCVDFEEVCGRAVGVTDYISLCTSLHTLIITNVPQMHMGVRDKARRFINLVDQIYNHRVKCVLYISVPLDQLFCGTVGSVDSSGMELNADEKPTGIDMLGIMRNEERPVAEIMRVGGGTLFTGEDEVFAFHRAVSRLVEMQTKRYLQSCLLHRGVSPKGHDAEGSASSYQ